MTTINLRELYPWYTEDTFIEVSDEVAAFLEEDKRLQINYAQYIRDNKAFYDTTYADSRASAASCNMTAIPPARLLCRNEYEQVPLSYCGGGTKLINRRCVYAEASHPQRAGRLL